MPPLDGSPARPALPGRELGARGGGAGTRGESSAKLASWSSLAVLTGDGGDRPVGAGDDALSPDAYKELISLENAASSL